MNRATSLEVEWQFEAPDLDVVERWLGSQPAYAPIALDDRGQRTQHDTYLDSADWRLFHAGYSLRVRTKDSGSEVTLKALGRQGGPGPARRSEFSEAGLLEAAADGDGPVGARLRLILRHAPLRPLFSATTQRHTWAVRADSADLAEVAVDLTTVTVEGTTSTLRRVEVEELRPGGLDEAQAFVEALRTACGLMPATTSKFEAGLGLAGLHPGAADLGPTDITADDRGVERAYAVLRRRFGELRMQEGGTALGEDPEALHQMRVATRRVRAALQVFAPVLPPEVLALRDELRWFGQALGTVRDLDVQLEHLEALRRANAWDERNALAPLVAQFARERDSGRTALLDALNSDRYARLVESCWAQLMAGPPEGGPEDRSRQLGRRVISQRYRRFDRDARSLRRRSPPAEYHALRIRGKRLRYSLELFVDLYGREGALALASLRSFQNLLGELQDLTTTDERLRGLVRTHASELPPDTLVMVGRLIEQHRVRSAEIIDAFPTARRLVVRRFDRLWRSPRWRRGARREEEPAGETPAIEASTTVTTEGTSEPLIPDPEDAGPVRNPAWTFFRMFRRDR